MVTRTTRVFDELHKTTVFSKREAGLGVPGARCVSLDGRRGGVRVMMVLVGRDALVSATYADDSYYVYGESVI